MVAVDTNVIVRLLTGDDPAQEAVARTLFATGPVWIAKTVLLEAAWVLRSLYHHDDQAICEGFIKLLGLTNVRMEDEADVANALHFCQQGVEIADAFHLTSRQHGAEFVSFDKAFVKRAKKLGAVNVSGLVGKK